MMLQKIYVSQSGTYYRLLLFFDPLALIAPITLQPKLLYQVCRKKYDWDEQINDMNINDKWSKFLRELKLLTLWPLFMDGVQLPQG